MLSLLACFSFIVYHMLTFIRYIEVYFMIALLDYVRYNEDFVTQRFVKSRFCSIHFTVILAGPKKIRLRAVSLFSVVRRAKREKRKWPRA